MEKIKCSLSIECKSNGWNYEILKFIVVYILISVYLLPPDFWHNSIHRIIILSNFDAMLNMMSEIKMLSYLRSTRTNQMKNGWLGNRLKYMEIDLNTWKLTHTVEITFEGNDSLTLIFTFHYVLVLKIFLF